MADTEEVVEEYRSSLADLTINSKPLISMLTMLAEDHSQYAEHIVQQIEQHLQKVKPSQKLPVLYLIDSIIKNLSEYSYSRLFSKNIVSIFCDTFQKVDEKTRGAMYKLRQTWQMYYPNPKLYALDMRVNMMDPAWPIIAEPPEQGNIHVNPRFLVQDDDGSAIGDPAAHSMKASAIRSLPSMVASKPVMPKTYSPADTTSAVVSNPDSSIIKINKLPLPKIDPELPTPKSNDIGDIPSSIVSKTHPTPVSTSTKPGLNVVKARDPRLTRDPRLASRDPRQMSQRRVVINEINPAISDNKTSSHSSKSESTAKAPTISPSLLSNMRSLDAVKSHSKTHLVTEIEKNKPSQTGSVNDNRGRSTNDGLVNQDLVAADSNNQSKPSSTSVPSETHKSNESGKDYSDVSHLRPSPPNKFPDSNPATSLVTAASSKEANTSKQPDMDIISSTIEIADDMSDKPLSDSDDVQFIPSESTLFVDRNKDRPNDRNLSRMRDRRRGSEESDKGRRRDDYDRDRRRYGRDSRNNRRDDDRRNRHRDDDIRDRNTDQFGRERRSNERVNRRKDRYDDDDYDRYPRRRRDRSPMRNRSPENRNSRGWSQDDRKPYKDAKNDGWKNSYDNSDSQLSNDSNQNRMGNAGRSPNSSSGKDIHVNHRHGSASPNHLTDDKSNIGKNLKRDRDYRDDPKMPSPQRDHDICTSPKRVRPDQPMESQSDRHLDTKEDISDLFGKGDQDYRVPTNQQGIPYMRSGSHTGWAKFKADHPEGFNQDEAGPGSNMDIDERYKDVDMRWNNTQRPGDCMNSPMAKQLLSPRIDGSARNKQANFIRGAAELAQSGKISHEEHQLVLKQIDQLQNLTYESGKLTDNHRHNPDATERDLDHKQIEHGKPNWVGKGSDLSSDANSRSPHRDNVGNAPHIGATRPQPPNQDGNMRDMPMPRMPINIHTAPPNHPHNTNNMGGWNSANLGPPENMYDLRWKGNSVMADNDVSGEVVIDSKPYEIVANGKPRKIRLHGKNFEIHADARERAIFVNNTLCYRFGEIAKDVQIDGRWHKFHYQGLPKSLWIDQQWYEVRVDSPPRRIILDKEEHSLQIDGRDMMVFIDRIEQGIYGGAPRNIFVKNVCHEIRFDPPPRQILIDGKPCELKLNCKIPFVVIDGKPHGIRFDGPPRDVIIDDNSYLVPVDKPIKIRIGKRPHILAFGGPAHEVIIDGKWFEVRFDGPPVEVHLGNRMHTLMLKGASPTVKILGELPMMMNEPNRPQFNFNGANMFPPAGAMMNDFNRPRGPENFQHRPPTWELPFVRRPNHPEPIPMIRPFVPDRPLENLRFPGHPGLPPGLIGPGPMQHFPGPFFPGLPPNLNAVTLPPMTSLPPGMAPVNQDSNSNPAAPVPPQIPQITLSSAGLTSVTCPGMPSIPNAPTVLATAPTGLPRNARLPAPNMAVGSGAAGLLPGIPTSVLNKLIRPAPPMLSLSQPPPAQPAVPAGPVDVSGLFQKLVDAGIIPTVTAEKEKEKVPEKEKEPELEIIPDLCDFKTEKLKIRYSKFIDDIYEGIQCSSCGIRFTVDDTEKYREHLDWHFRQNKREKDDYKVAKYRKWYYEMSEWIQYEEIQDDEEKNRSNFFENMLNPVQEPAFVGPQGNKVIQCPAATGNDMDDVCDICGDPFEQFWEEDEEEWHLRNAVRVEGKTYHPVCYEDVKESVETPSVDTPREEVEENPLETALKSTTTADVVPVTNAIMAASNPSNASMAVTTASSIGISTPSTLEIPAVTTAVTKCTDVITPEDSTANSATISTDTTTTSSEVVLPPSINPVTLAANLPSSTLSDILAAVASSAKSSNALTSLLADGSSRLSPPSTNVNNNLPGNNNANTLPSSSVASGELDNTAQPIATIVSTTGLKNQGL